MTTLAGFPLTSTHTGQMSYHTDLVDWSSGQGGVLKSLRFRVQFLGKTQKKEEKKGVLPKNLFAFG
jgi:hypothetical protein